MMIMKIMMMPLNIISSLPKKRIKKEKKQEKSFVPELEKMAA